MKGFKCQEVLDFPNLRKKNVEIQALLLGGSHLYGLNNKDSDRDIRGVYSLRNKAEILGLGILGNRDFESITFFEGDDDFALYEIRRFLNLLKKTNSQAIEILFAQDINFFVRSPFFKSLQKRKWSLLDSAYFLNSMKGYVHNEIRLTLGERMGKLGGKRKEALERYGYSYKNLVQVLRLSYCSSEFFLNNRFPVNIKNEPIFDELVHIKENPQEYNYQFAKERTANLISILEESFENRKNTWKFDEGLANSLIFEAYDY